MVVTWRRIYDGVIRSSSIGDTKRPYAMIMMVDKVDGVEGVD